MKIEIKIIAIIFTILVALMSPLYGWMWSIEKRMSTVEATQDIAVRVKNLEDALLPVLVEYKLQIELDKIRREDEVDEVPAPEISEDRMDRAARERAKERLREDASKWAEDKLRKPVKES